MRSYLPVWVAFALLLASSVTGQTVSSRTVQTPANDGKPDDRCLVQGRVTDSLTGEPVGEASLRLQRRSPSGEAQSYPATSQPDGTYRFENIEPGYYNLAVTRRGYADSAYHATSAMPLGDVVRLRPGQQWTNVPIALTPLGVITGTVFDQSGKPVPNAWVQVLLSAWNRGILRTYGQSGAKTDDLGRYRIVNVHPGKYDVVVQPAGAGLAPTSNPPSTSEKRDVGPVRTYYPSALSVDTATTVGMKSGQELTEIDVALRTAATYHIRGKVTGTLPDGTTEKVRLMLSPFDGGMISGLAKDMLKLAGNRTFDIPDVAAGRYTVCLLSANGPVKLLARQDVEVSQADVNDVSLTIPHISIYGNVTIQGNPQPGVAAITLKNLYITLHGAEAPIMLAGLVSSPVNDDGTFKLEDLAPGRYDFLGPSSGPNTYQTSVLFNNKEILGQALDLIHGGGEVNVILRYGPAAVKGIVTGLQNHSTAANPSPSGETILSRDVTVALVADTAPEDFFGIRVTVADGKGSFGMSNIQPHRYRAYAIEKLERNQLENPEVLRELESKATEIELGENDKKQIQLPLITAGEMQDIYSRLGIEPLLAEK